MHHKTRHIGILLGIPGIIGFMIFYIIPFIGSVYYSFIENTLTKKFVFFKHYIQILQNPYYQLALKNTIKFTLISVPILIILSFLVAVMLSEIRGNVSFFRASFLMPVLMPSISLVMFWKIVFGNQGQLADLIVNNLKIMTEDSYMIIPVYIFFIWKNIGFHILLYVAAIIKIPREITEAAKLDGSSIIMRYRYITIPMILPTIFFGLIMCIVQSFRIFKEVYLLHGSYPNDNLYFIQHYINNKFLKLDYGELSAGTIIFVLFIILLLAIINVIKRKLQL